MITLTPEAARAIERARDALAYLQLSVKHNPLYFDVGPPSYLEQIISVEFQPGDGERLLSDLAALLRSTIAAPQSADAEGWRPIESAPRDGEDDILVCNARVLGGSQQVVTYDPLPDNPDWCWATADGPTYNHKDLFTHWRPLPDPPQAPSHTDMMVTPEQLDKWFAVREEARREGAEAMREACAKICDELAAIEGKSGKKTAFRRCAREASAAIRLHPLPQPKEQP